MKSATWIAALAILVCNPLLLRSLDNGDSFAKTLSSAKAADIAVPEAVPAAVKTGAQVKAAGVMDSYDSELGARLAGIAEKRSAGAWTRSCYNFVAWDMHYAGILDFNSWVAMGIQPDYSDRAFQFAQWASLNEEKMRREMKLAVLPTPESKDEVPLGSILVYDRGWCGFSSKSGHIEVLTAPDRACSDNCESLDQNCFASPDIREHVHVYIPVKD